MKHFAFYSLLYLPKFEKCLTYMHKNCHFQNMSHIYSRLLVYPKCYVYTWQSIDPSLKTIEHYHGLN